VILEIDDKLISSEILTTRFLCDLSQCRGICCVEGNAGAPLEAAEIDRLVDDYDEYKPYLTPAGIEAIERQGFFVVDGDGDLTTPLVADAECAFSCVRDGITGCAVERAYLAGKTRFRKPISCHLYPIRLAVFRDGSIGLNYHRWSVCECARRRGEREGVPLYRALEEPIVRRFGREFFEQLEAATEVLKKEQKEEGK
jgi:hypothetical protein